MNNKTKASLGLPSRPRLKGFGAHALPGPGPGAAPAGALPCILPPLPCPPRSSTGSRTAFCSSAPAGPSSSTGGSWPLGGFTHGCTCADLRSHRHLKPAPVRRPCSCIRLWKASPPGPLRGPALRLTLHSGVNVCNTQRLQKRLRNQQHTAQRHSKAAEQPREPEMPAQDPQHQSPAPSQPSAGSAARPIRPGGGGWGWSPLGYAPVNSPGDARSALRARLRPVNSPGDAGSALRARPPAALGPARAPLRPPSPLARAGLPDRHSLCSPSQRPQPAPQLPRGRGRPPHPAPASGAPGSPARAAGRGLLRPQRAARSRPPASRPGPTLHGDVPGSLRGRRPLEAHVPLAEPGPRAEPY